MTETELRDRLQSAAHRAGPGVDELAAADAVIDRRRTERRRRRTAGVCAAACAVLAAVLVPTVGRHWLTGQAPASPGAPTTAASRPTAHRWPDPPRGSLAGDPAFLAAVRNLPWPDHGVSAPVASRSVVFAGDAGGVRWVLVAGPVKGQLTGQWFAGPAGAAATALTNDGPDDLQGGLPIGHVHLDASGASLLVLTDPGNTVQVSPGVVLDADGRARRDYAAVPVDAGVAVVHEAGNYAGAAASFRVFHDGVLAGQGRTDAAFTVPADLGDAARQTPRRPSSGSAPEGAVMNALQPVLTATGLDPAQVHPVLLWTGPIPLQGGLASSQAVVLALTLPSGAVVTTTAFESAADVALPSGTCGAAAHPAGTSLDSLVVVARCDTSGGTGGRPTFVVSAPAADDRVLLQAVDGSTVASGTLVGGAGVLPDPGGVAVAGVQGSSAPAVLVPPSDESPRDDPFTVY